MPVSLFKSRPKSDRRLEWRNLKASHAKLLETKKLKVEIGLGKDLDSFQKHVDSVLKLEAAQLTKAAFAPLLRTTAKVKQHVETLEDRVKNQNLDKFEKFLSGLKKDVEWWEKAAHEFKPAPAQVDVKKANAVEHILESLEKAKPHMAKMDELLKGAAVTVTATYDPPAYIVNWSNFHKAIQPTQKKLALLGKNRTGNHDLILSLLRNMHEPIDDLVRNLIFLNRSNLKALNAPVDWDEVKQTANDILLHIGAVDTQLGKL